jgi:hypothetical protein
MEVLEPDEKRLILRKQIVEIDGREKDRYVVRMPFVFCMFRTVPSGVFFRSLFYRTRDQSLAIWRQTKARHAKHLTTHFKFEILPISQPFCDFLQSIGIITGE